MHQLEANDSNIVESCILSCPFLTIYFETQIFSIYLGCLLGAKSVLSCTGRDINYTTQLYNVEKSFIKCGCDHICEGDFYEDGNIMWLEHDLWMLIHKVGDFFPTDALKKSILMFLRCSATKG